jgi:monoamine oxidase
MKRIAVVGGGPSGLFSAYLLEQKSRGQAHVTLFEASGRIGGKILTARFDSAPVLYEAGVAELYGYGADPLRNLVTDVLGLPVVPMTGDTLVLDGRPLRGEAGTMRHLGADTTWALRTFRRSVRAARPYAEFYNSAFPSDRRHPWLRVSLSDLFAQVRDETAQRFLRVLVHCDLATEPHLTSALYGVDNYLINEPDYCQLYSIEGGISRLVQGLAERLRARVRLGTSVVGVERTRTRSYRVAFTEGEQAGAEEYDAVVIALPVAALRDVDWGSRALRAAVESHVARYDAPAHYLRITALFRTPFWRGTFSGAYFIHDAFGGCCVYDEGARNDAHPYGVLSFLLSGSDAMILSNLRDEELIARALDSLPRAITGPVVARAELVEGRVHRWVGAVNGLPGSTTIQGSKQRHEPEPVDHRGLVLAGDYLFDSTVNGAFDSANIATSAALDRLRVARTALGLSLDDAPRDEATSAIPPLSLPRRGKGSAPRCGPRRLVPGSSRTTGPQSGTGRPPRKGRRGTARSPK